jgi:flagellar protein FliS
VYAANPYQQYRVNQITTASPEALVTMLYDGALRFCHQAEAHIDQKNISGAHEALTRAQDIIAELLSGLNPEAGEIAQNLSSLYTFMMEQLVQANIRKDKQPIDDVVKLLTDLRTSWVEAVAIAHKQQPVVSTGGF